MEKVDKLPCAAVSCLRWTRDGCPLAWNCEDFAWGKEGKTVHYEDLIERLRKGTGLPMVQALMNEAADAIEELTKLTALKGIPPGMIGEIPKMPNEIPKTPAKSNTEVIRFIEIKDIGRLAPSEKGKEMYSKEKKHCEAVMAEILRVIKLTEECGPRPSCICMTDELHSRLIGMLPALFISSMKAPVQLFGLPLRAIDATGEDFYVGIGGMAAFREESGA